MQLNVNTLTKTDRLLLKYNRQIKGKHLKLTVLTLPRMQQKSHDIKYDKIP